MSVGELLGLDGNSALLATARRRWPVWVAADVRLAQASSFDDLIAKLRGMPIDQGDSCRHALARLAATDGGDDPIAAVALAKILLPGTTLLAARLTNLVCGGGSTFVSRDRVNQAVAAQLWIEVRSFDWQHLTKVGGNILMNVRAAVLRDLGDVGQLERSDRTWARTDSMDHERLSLVVEVMGGPAPSPASGSDLWTSADEVSHVLGWACQNKVITESDGALIRCLLAEAEQVEVRSTSRSAGNLCGRELSEAVARKVGVSSATVRRRASRSVKAIALAVSMERCA